MTNYILRSILAILTLSVFVGGLFLVFIRDHAGKSSLWLSAALQEGQQVNSRQYISHALIYDPYNPRLWALAQTKPYQHDENEAALKAQIIADILKYPITPNSIQADRP